VTSIKASPQWGSDPIGDEKFFALSRQAKCIPVVATPSTSSLRLKREVIALARKWSGTLSGDRLLERLGVHLNPEKTRIVHVRFGFEFLGYQIKRGRPRQLGNRKLGRTAPAGSLYAHQREKSIRRFKDQAGRAEKR
jgi:hypothetical protein